MRIEDKKLPNGWRLVKLGDVSNRIHYGFTASADFSRTETRLLRITDIQDGLVKWNKVPGCKISPDEEADNLLTNGDIVIARTGATTGKSFLIQNPPRAVVASYLIRIQPSSKILPQYLYYFCQSSNYWKQIEANARGAAQEGVNATLLSSLILPLPPLAEQKRIASIAQKADRLRRTRRYALQLSDTYLRSLFLEMFGDPLTNPMGWKTKCLGELGNGENAIVDGPFGSSVDTKIDYIPNGEIPVIRSKNIRPFGFITDDLKFISREKFNLLIRSRVVPGDILVVKVGVNLGDVCIFTDIFKEAVLSTTGSCKITPNNNMVNTNYLACYLYFLKEQMRKISSESALPFLNMTTIKEFKIALPPLPLQDKFAQIVQKFDRLRTQQREADRQAEHLFQTILHRAFRGELTSQNADDEPESVLLEEIRAQQAKAEAEAKTATQAMGDAADYVGTKAKQQDIEPIQLKFPGFE